MLRHAFLIIAHNEFGSLQRLINALDVDGYDIYVHIDARVRQLPELKSHRSRLTVLEQRMKVIWGHESQPQCEMLLMETAAKSGMQYDFYHLISGTHYPVADKKGMDEFFGQYAGKSIFQPIGIGPDEKLKRFGRYHFFLPYYSSRHRIVNKPARFLWKAMLYAQKKLHISRDYSFLNGKASNWCALSADAVKAILTDKQLIKKRFHRTLCSDEWYKLSVLSEHKLPIVNTDRLLIQFFHRGNPRVLEASDYEAVKSSGCIFGRKFTNASRQLVEILKNGQD